jgi:hypothetical protein
MSSVVELVETAFCPLGSQLRAELAQHPVDLEEIVAQSFDAKERLIDALYSRPLQHLI